MPVWAKNAEDYNVLVSSFNTKTVYNGPTEAASFNIDMDTMLQAITTYHYNYGNGSTPGAISILEDGVKVGEWQATDRENDTFWDVFPDFVLKPGKEYTIVDSDNDTWSCNEDSHDMGFVELRGYGMSSSDNSSAPSKGDSSNPVSSSGEIKIYVNDAQVYPDSAPVIINDRTLVPIRAVAEAMGYTVDWDGVNRIVNIHNDEISLNLRIDLPYLVRYTYGSQGETVNTETLESDIAPQIINERTYLPLRAVAEALDAGVDWDGNVHIYQ